MQSEESLQCAPCGSICLNLKFYNNKSLYDDLAAVENKNVRLFSQLNYRWQSLSDVSLIKTSFQLKTKLFYRLRSVDDALHLVMNRFLYESTPTTIDYTQKITASALLPRCLRQQQQQQQLRLK